MRPYPYFVSNLYRTPSKKEKKRKKPNWLIVRSSLRVSSFTRNLGNFHPGIWTHLLSLKRQISFKLLLIVNIFRSIKCFGKGVRDIHIYLWYTLEGEILINRVLNSRGSVKNFFLKKKFLRTREVKRTSYHLYCVRPKVRDPESNGSTFCSCYPLYLGPFQTENARVLGWPSRLSPSTQLRLV